MPQDILYNNFIAFLFSYREFLVEKRHKQSSTLDVILHDGRKTFAISLASYTMYNVYVRIHSTYPRPVTSCLDLGAKAIIRKLYNYSALATFLTTYTMYSYFCSNLPIWQNLVFRQKRGNNIQTARGPRT